ncbi:MAG: sulfatase-like hydrolase/transferase [Paludibacteraceae bacterium]|nr:sulfatase-like hydrolase/transferase [Paludibacteraceae bacterium]
MKQRLLLFFKYYLFWIVLFQLQKLFFILVQYKLMGDISLSDCLQVMAHAFPLDLSVASYITAVFGLLLVVSNWLNVRVIRYISHVFTAVVLAIVVFVLIGDNSTFSFWGYHWDKSIFTFLQSPKEVLACAVWWQWILVTILFLLWFVACGFVYLKWLKWDKVELESRTTTRLWQTGVWLLITAFLFLPMRGSVTVSTMNTGRVYFSNNQMLNQAAVNPLFNIIESLSENTFDLNKYTYMSSVEAQQLTQQLLSADRWTHTEEVFATQRPNIVLVILESFSSNALDAMPNLMRLAQEGIYFSNAYSSSYRTDRGIVSLMSAFPGQPTSSLMTVPSKSRNLPQIGKALKQEGYLLNFYYGGDEDFTNMRSYLIDGGFENRVVDKDFPLQDRMSKWGAHDHIVLERASREIRQRYTQYPDNQYFDVILTLSSHEPFDVPFTSDFSHAYLNSVAYTDSCLGAFVDSLKQHPLWDSTIVILSPDHGYPYPNGIANYNPLRYRIPMAIIGGAVQQPMPVPTLCSQIDLVPIVLHAMGLDAEAYPFSKNILDSTQTEFAFYAFNDGFALLTPQDTIIVDAKSNMLLHGNNEFLNQQAHAFMQCIMEEIDQF